MGATHGVGSSRQLAPFRFSSKRAVSDELKEGAAPEQGLKVNSKKTELKIIKMQNEQSFEETQGLFETLKGFIDTLEESPDSERKISGILTLLKSMIELLEADRNVSSQQSETLYTLDKSLQASAKAAIEFDDRITKLNELVIEVATNSSKLAEEVKEIAETAAKIPAINIDNLLKTLNKHAEEINQNAASIKEIKDKLIN